MGKTGGKRQQPVADAAEGSDITDRLPRPDEAGASAATSAAADGSALEAEIRHRAYERYLTRGDGPGSEVEDWCAAERDVHEARRMVER